MKAALKSCLLKAQTWEDWICSNAQRAAGHSQCNSLNMQHENRVRPHVLWENPLAEYWYQCLVLVQPNQHHLLAWRIRAQNSPLQGLLIAKCFRREELPNKMKIHTAFAFSNEFTCILHLLSTVAAISRGGFSFPLLERCWELHLEADLPPLPGKGLLELWREGEIQGSLAWG